MNKDDDKISKAETSISETIVNINFTGVTLETIEDLNSFLMKTLENYGVKIYDNINEVTILEELGKGAFGTVYKAKIGDEFYAIKLLENMDTTSNPQENLTTIIKELIALTKVNHEKIPKFNGIYHNKETGKIGLIFTFIEGNTLNIHLEKNKLTKLQKIDLIIQLTEILKALHEKRVIHRDIKPKNTMVTPQNKLILIDFGISKVNTKTLDNTVSVKGSPAYSPPEAFVDTSDTEDRQFIISTKFDIWSLGCVIYEVFAGEKPWVKKYKDSNKIIFMLSKKKLIGEHGIPLIPTFSTDYPEIFNLLKKCVAIEVDQRYSSEELLKKLIEIREIYKKEEEV
jgi:serine/threonine protein kinase